MIFHNLFRYFNFIGTSLLFKYYLKGSHKKGVFLSDIVKKGRGGSTKIQKF